MHWTEQNEQAAAALASPKFVTSSGFARADCPFCLAVVGKEDRKQCFSVNTRTGSYKCWRCGTSGRVQVEPGTVPEVPTKAVERMQPPEGYLPLCQEPARSSLAAEEARDFLRGRGLEEPVWRAAHIGCCLSGRYEGRVIVPVISPSGEWVGWVGRAWVRKCAKAYYNAPGMSLGELTFNHRALLTRSAEPACVMEGVFDALAHWPDAVGVLGKPTEAQVWAMVRAPRPVAVVLDGDAWEEGWMLALRLRLEGQQAGAVKLPPRVDPDEVSRAALRAAAQASISSEDGLVRL